MNDKNINSSDATTGQSMVARVLARKAELEALLAGTPSESSRTQSDITTALDTVNAMLSGDLANVPHVVVAEMNRWLENNKHLAETSSPTPTTDVASAPPVANS